MREYRDGIESDLRILSERKDEGKETPIVYDIVDQGKFFEDAFKKRKSIYKKNGNELIWQSKSNVVAYNRLKLIFAEATLILMPRIERQLSRQALGRGLKEM